ncbi:DASH complex subunit DAM1 [Cladophialophora yegresii CBS 114405]|uniref:DASH complex subunit DAM1 n=1 Tax=Cladophialophora yegresii CBS 114405 TaxID=1182544 RepID=W9VWD5_9EURO|nr:DASH complex subunit DAM1 [Cladophialophora yegresii CBS 114405]EXJ60147.1 DASH complex subunit DAM1 [Cladophialophora yegresii CBS 114405]
MAQPRQTTLLPVRTRSRSPTSRPTTPLRASSRSSFRASTTFPSDTIPTGLDHLEPQFAELSDSMADLEANLMHLQLMHESLSRFGESFASFLYGLNMNAFVVDFPEAPITESIKRWQRRQAGLDEHSTTMNTNITVPDSTSNSFTVGGGGVRQAQDNPGDATFVTNADASFVSLKATPRRKTVAPPVTPGTTSTVNQQSQSRLPGARRGGGPGAASRGGRGDPAARGARGSGLPRGRGRGREVR